MNQITTDAAGVGAGGGAGAVGSVVLFDGVCNLCNGFVAWVIERDPPRARLGGRGVFRFASLQSEAGRRALERAGVDRAALPASIVLIDGRGRVRTRSSAALGIARGLGLPWSAAGALGMIVPRFVRDAVYDEVARNRYRWFGRRESCLMPTEALAARFLDAGESPSSAAPTGESAGVDGSGAAADERGSWLGLFALRSMLAWLVLMIFPFPLNLIPWVTAGAEWITDGTQRAAQWVAQRGLGVEAPIQLTGSGDTMVGWVTLGLMTSLSLVIGLAWKAWRGRRRVSARVFDLVRTYCRYVLGTVMLSYGFAKVFPAQFPMPGPDRLLVSFAETSPMGLLWAFMGASPVYQMFGGAMEVLGGALLFWRRTTLLGSLVCAGVLLNVVMLNFCYDVPVKWYSSMLLLMALFLAAPDAMRLCGVLLLNLPAQPAALRPFPPRNAWVRRGAVVIKAGVIGLAAWWSVTTAWEQLHQSGLLAERGPMLGIYTVESFERGSAAGEEGVSRDGATPDAERWVRVGIDPVGIGAIQTADGAASRMGMQIQEPNAASGTLVIRRRGEPEYVKASWSWVEEGVLRLEGTVRGAPFTAVLRRKPVEETVLLGRGFHWVQEFPYNR